MQIALLSDNAPFKWYNSSQQLLKNFMQLVMILHGSREMSVKFYIATESDAMVLTGSMC